ncbi:MAG: 1-(5-phosphoribosyl)-5-[(5-phosphoribosylamino)methylideneamino]imidazole-4-carboxamide isomerase [Acidimicrobiales bacterium]
MASTPPSSRDAGFHLYPAIDLRDGRCVRLYQGDYSQETVYGDDPVAQAKVFADAGAAWIHVVDLDAARSGEPVNRPVIGAIAAAVAVPVQTGGGVRSLEAARALFDLGVSRVVVGTAAMTDPDLVPAAAGFGRVAVGLDVRGREVAVRGWTISAGVQLLDAVASFSGSGSGVDAFVVTQIEVDGTHAGPDVATYRELLAATDVEVIASGGVGALDHLVVLRELQVSGRRLGGVIVGRALYDGAFSAAEAVGVCRG